LRPHHQPAAGIGRRAGSSNLANWEFHNPCVPGGTRYNGPPRRVGHQELLSTTYDVLSARSSVNLWEFARDPVVRDAGEALTLYHVALHALNNFDGHTMPPLNRRRDDLSTH
jgi:hypothetical protein